MNEYCVQYNLQYVLMMMMMLFCVADESLQAWRNGTRQWVGNLRNWLDFIQSVDSTFPSFNLDNLLDDIGKFEIEGDIGFIVILFLTDDDSKVQDVYTRIRRVWSNIFNAFDAKKQCST